MKVGALLVGNSYAGKLGQLIQLYSIEEVRNFPNVGEEVIKDCEDCLDFAKRNLRSIVVGFAKSIDFTDEEPEFIQIYNNEIKIIENIGGM